MTGRLEGKVAVVTGGASGMGQSTVLRFLEEGAKVVVADMNTKTGAATMDLIRDRGAADRAVFLAGDVADETHIEALVALAVERFGRLDCMFNNAGIGGAIGSITETEVDDWEFSFAVLVRSVFLGMKHAGRVLKQQREGGTIISTASIAGLSGGAGPHAYSAAKAAVINLTKSVSTELAHHSIRVNAIAPGAIITPLMHSGHAKKTEEMAHKITPWPRLGVGDDIANMALYLASDESEYITGQLMVVDGGASALGPRMWDNRPGSPVMRRAGLTRGSTGVGNTFRDV